MIAIGSDHAGYEFKERIKKLLEELGEKYIDYGTHSNESCDYPDYAKQVAQSILNNECTKGILICGTGIGMSIAANRFKGIRAAVCLNEYMAKVSRTHNNSNILAIGERTTPWVEVQRIVKVWLNSEFEGGRHLNRIEKMDQ